MNLSQEKTQAMLEHMEKGQLEWIFVRCADAKIFAINFNLHDDVDDYLVSEKAILAATNPPSGPNPYTILMNS